MKYPNPAYAATIWYNGQGFTLILPAPHGGERRFTFTDLREAEEHLRMLHASVTVEREARLTNKHGGTAVLEGHGDRVEFDLTGGRYSHLAKAPRGPSREELRLEAERLLRQARSADKLARAQRRAKAQFTLEDLGL